MIPRVRRIIVGVIIASFALAAIGGIIVLLGAELGDTAARVLGTTATVGVFSVAVLCCSALIGRRLRVVGLIGVAVAVVAAALVLVTVWAPNWPGETFSKVLGSAIAATVALSFASLLLLLADRHRTAVRVGLTITLALFALLLTMTLVLLWAPELFDSEFVPRVMGITAILSALGAVTVPVMSLLMPDDRARGADVAVIDPDLARRLTVEAERRRISVEQLVAPVFASEGQTP